MTTKMCEIGVAKSYITSDLCSFRNPEDAKKYQATLNLKETFIQSLEANNAGNGGSKYDLNEICELMVANGMAFRDVLNDYVYGDILE